MTVYYTALICQNGHVFTASAAGKAPPRQPKFCPICGQCLLSRCRHCGALIPGLNQKEEIPSICSYEPPHYCTHCGKAYPWLK